MRWLLLLVVGLLTRAVAVETASVGGVVMAAGAACRGAVEAGSETGIFRVSA